MARKLYSYNGAHQKCADCGVLPGSLHKASCNGGCHDFTVYKAHKFRGNGRVRRCKLCHALRSFGVHLKAARVIRKKKA